MSTSRVQVRFNPSAVGTRTATLSVGNNDANENPYDFALLGDRSDRRIGIHHP